MTAAEIFLRKKGITGDFSTKRMIPTVEKDELIIDWFQQFADEQLKAKMPSSQKVNKEAARMYKEAWEADYAVENFITGVKWLKQQIL